MARRWSPLAFLLLQLAVLGVCRSAAPQSRARIGGAGGAGPMTRLAAAASDVVGRLRDAVVKPATPRWPERFGALLFQNRTGQLALTELYYDWPSKRNLNVIRTQLGARGVVYDLEFDNGTSFVFSHDPPLCKVLHFDVGILFPDWMANATLLGQDASDGFVVDVWTKAEFIKYYNDAASDRPVRWTFLGSGADLHVMNWSPGDALPAARWQAPPWCFDGRACVPGGGGGGAGSSSGGGDACAPSVLDEPAASGRLFRLPPAKRPERRPWRAAAVAAAKAGVRSERRPF